MQLAVDSSVLVAAFRPEELHHESSSRFLRQLLDGTHTAVAPLTVLVEVGAALRRRTGSSTLARQIVNELLDLETLDFWSLTPLRARFAVEIAISFGLRGMDANVVQVAQELHCPMVTLDQEMIARVDGVVTVLPLEQL